MGGKTPAPQNITNKLTAIEKEQVSGMRTVLQKVYHLGTVTSKVNLTTRDWGSSYREQGSHPQTKGLGPCGIGGCHQQGHTQKAWGTSTTKRQANISVTKME